MAASHSINDAETKMMEIFKQVTEELKEKILHFALLNKTMIVFKYADSKVIRTHIESLSRKYYITCKRPKELITLRTKEEAMAVLPYAEERYFFKSYLLVEGNYLLFKRDSEFYHLKRRRNRRIKIPSSYLAFLMIKKQNFNLTFLKAVLLDFSESGCKVALNTDTPLFKKGDELIGTLRIGTKNGVEVNAELMHCFRSEKGKFKQTFGLRFIKTSHYQESYLKTLYSELQSELQHG